MSAVQEPRHYRRNEFPFCMRMKCLNVGEGICLHWHASLEMLCILEGECVTMQNNLRCTYRKGDIGIINPNTIHFTQSLTGCRYYCLLFTPEECRQFGLDSTALRFPTQLCDPKITEAFEEIYLLLGNGTQQALLAARLRVLSLLAYAAAMYAVENTPDTHAPKDKRFAVTKKVIEYIQQHYAENITVDSICASVNFSKYYVCHCFRSYTGHTIIEHLNLFRCITARSLLTGGHCNVTEAAERCGFQNLGYFTKTYKKYLGSLPSSDIRSRDPVASSGDASLDFQIVRFGSKTETARGRVREKAQAEAQVM